MTMDEYFETARQKGLTGRYYGFILRVNGRMYEYFLRYDLSNNHFEILAEKIHYKFNMSFYTNPNSLTKSSTESFWKIISGTYRLGFNEIENVK
jgi:hypothetical protein